MKRTRLAYMAGALALVMCLGSVVSTTAVASRSGDGTGSRYGAAGGNTGDQNRSYHDDGAGTYQGRH